MKRQAHVSKESLQFSEHHSHISYHLILVFEVFSSLHSLRSGWNRFLF